MLNRNKLWADKQQRLLVRAGYQLRVNKNFVSLQDHMESTEAHLKNHILSQAQHIICTCWFHGGMQGASLLGEKKKNIPSDLSVSIVQSWCCAGSRRRPHLLMGALCTATLLLQVLLIALPLLLQQAESGGGRRPSQDVLHRRPPSHAVAQHPGEPCPCWAQRVYAAVLSFVVLSAEVQDGLQPLPLLQNKTQKTLFSHLFPFTVSKTRCQTLIHTVSLNPSSILAYIKGILDLF